MADFMPYYLACLNKCYFLSISRFVLVYRKTILDFQTIDITKYFLYNMVEANVRTVNLMISGRCVSWKSVMNHRNDWHPN